MTDRGRDEAKASDGTGANAGEETSRYANPESLTLSTRLSEGADRFRTRFRLAARALDRSVRHSRLAAVGRRIETAIQHSWIVRWLTREPDPDVVVIDLAETRTIGPILRVLDRVAGALASPAESSGLRRTGERLTATVERHAVPAASGALLGLVVGTLALTVESADPLWLAALAIAGVAGLLGLTVDRSRAALRESRVATAVADLVAPPETDDGASEPAPDRTPDDRTR